MKDIDWSKAPEGATHYAFGFGGWHASWYIVDGDKICTMLDDGCDDEWDTRDIDAEDREELLPRLIARPAEWGGTGLPPVGVVCLTEHEGKDIKVEILAYGKHGNDDAVLVAERIGTRPGVMYGWIAGQCDFRHIRTPEQIAAEERGAAVQTMVNRFALHAHPDIQWHALFEQMYDCGCRMTAEDER